MGYLPQDDSYFRKLSVEENLMAIMEFLPYSRADEQAHAGRPP